MTRSRFPSPGTFRDVDAFLAHWQGIAAELGADRELEGAAGPLGQTLEIPGRTIRNRFAIHPMEGWDGGADGLPSEHTVRRWQRFGKSGAGLIWGGEAFAVCPQGRANPGQLFLNPERDMRAALARLLGELRGAAKRASGADEEQVVGLQLTHSGRYAAPDQDGPRPRIAFRHPVLDRRRGVDSDQPILSDDELRRLQDDFVAAARTAAAAGFDFVDIKSCHGYLLNELLAAHSRPGPYGGEFDNRTRFLRETIAAVRAECPGLGIGVRVSIGDVIPHSPDASGRGAPEPFEDHLPYRYGFGVDADDPRLIDLAEPIRLLKLLRDLDIRLVNLSLGSPYTCPHLQRPAAHPPSDGYLPPDDPLGQVAEHLRTVRRCKAAVPELLLVGSGYTYLQEWLPHVAQHEIRNGHVDLVGLGRMVLSYPELPRDVLTGTFPRRASICRTFSDCTTGPRHGMISGCYPLDPYYRGRQEAGEIRKIRQQQKAASKREEES